MRTAHTAATIFCVLAGTLLSIASAKPVVKVGVIAPLSGNLAHNGEEFRAAGRMAVETLPPDTKVAFELIFEDNQNAANRTALAANKLIFQDRVDALLTLYSMPGNVVAPLAEKNKVLHFSVAFDATVAKGAYNFTHATPPPEMIGLLVRELKKKGLKRVAIARLNQQGINAQVTEFLAQAPRHGIQIVFDEKFNYGEKDFRMLIGKMEKTRPDIYFLMAFSPEQELFARQMREARVTKPLTTIGLFDMAHHSEVFEGCWYVSTAEPADALKEQLQKRCGRRVSNDNFNSYDMINLIAEAYNRATTGQAKPPIQSVVRELCNIKEYIGGTGRLTLDAEGIVHSLPALKMIRNAQPEAIAP
jgi:branched-chain amino acid transport system substrate-binding protein